MIEYIKTNLQPLLIGLSVGLAFTMTLNLISDIIIKITLILNK